MCLWNFKPLFIDEHVDNLENLSTLTTFTGSIDESWFYLTSVAIEARGAPILPLMLAAIGAARANDAATVIVCLRTFAERLDDLGTLLQRMHENCDPHVFYHHIRPFLAGSKNMAEAGLPNGVILDDGTGKDKYSHYSGGSNAQSSLIQFFDIVLGIQHRPTGEKKDSTATQAGTAPPPNHNFIQDMRNYMPGSHRRFLEDVTRCANIRDFVQAQPENHELSLAYDACLAMLRTFRDKHINIVTRYVVLKSKESSWRTRMGEGGVPAKQDIATSSQQINAADGKKNLRGTGGTALIPFLKQARDETSEPSIEPWAKRILNRNDANTGKGDFFLGKLDVFADDNIEATGLAGYWTTESDSGGICHY